ncbi:MAG: hypothetical protein KKE20_04590 [Nanoarchaeota archaeon]|nr:hypothetical protein [Nanoarchaeota archaeon]
MEHQIVKIGSACLFDENDKVDYPAISSKVKETIDYDRNHGTHTTLVVSGAVAFGRRALGEERSKKPMDMQRHAGVGQLELMARYSELFRNYGKYAVPMLLTYDDLKHHPEDICRSVMNHSEHGLYVLVNYNDATDFREVEYDNDELSAKLLTYCGSEKLIVLGRKYDGIMEGRRIIPLITDVNEFMHCDNGDRSSDGRGGFDKKMEAGRLVIEAGKRMIVGNIRYLLEDLIQGTCERTEFKPENI